MKARTLARSAAALVAVALVAGPLASGAQAAPKKKVPTPTITGKPASPTNVRSATFTFTDTQAGVTFQCALDGAAFAACTSPKTYAGPLSAATHSVKVRARDAAGTFSPQATASWTVDLTAPPVPSLSGVPANPTASTTASLTFSDTEAGATFRCSVDAAAAAACTSPRALSGLTDGAHTFTVAARDAAGNVSAVASGAWTVDTTPPPAPVVTTGPASPTNATTATFHVFEADSSAALSCSLDGAAYAACADPMTYGSLAEGAHTFVVRAADALGNAASAPQFAWTVDLTAPEPPAVVTGPNAVSGTGNASFTFDGHGAAGLRCSVDGAAYASCGTPHATGSLADGSHTLHVLAVDAASNESGATPYTWTVDTTPPPAPVVTGPANPSNAATATFGVSDAEPLAALTCALDGGTAATCASNVSYSGLADGGHSLVVTATDGAGNAAQTSYPWTIDRVVPTATFGAVPAITSAPLVSFSEAVHGVGNTSYSMRLTGTTTSVAATLTCADLSAITVSCATGAVRTARLQPNAPLVPGQRYTLVANPGSAATIADAAGNTVAATVLDIRANTTVQEDSVAARYGWQSIATSAAYGSQYKTEHVPNAAVTYAFTGTAVTWYTVRGRSQGLADVYVDNVKKATVNNYATTTSYRVARTVSGLTSAKHVLKIVVRGAKGSTAGTGTSVAVDAVKVGSTLTTNPSLTQLWRRMAVSGGGAMTCGDLGNEETALTFRGTGVTWWTSTGRNRGIAKVYVDGVGKATYDLWSSATAYNVRRAVTGLTDKTHTIRVVVTGTHRAGGTGSAVCLDRWTVA